MSMRVLVTAASRHESTAEIARAIAAGLNARGLHAETPPLEEAGVLAGFDAVVLGSAVYLGHWLKQAREFAQVHSAALLQRPVWLFSSGPVGPPEHRVPAEGPTDIETIAALTGARDHRVFAGVLDRSRLGVAERATVRIARVSEGDFRDWEAIEAYAGEIAAALLEPGAGTRRAPLGRPATALR